MHQSELRLKELIKQERKQPLSQELHQEPSTASLVDQSLAYLSSSQAIEELERNPYWPKWHGPWWQILLLHEMGLTDSLPQGIIEALINSTNKNMLKFFPIKDGDLPAEADPYRDVPCHCQLGCLYQVLAAAGAEPDKNLPWIKEWFLKYQLGDGGFNCDEQAYLKENGKSSIVSTLPVLEAVLYGSKKSSKSSSGEPKSEAIQRDFSKEELALLNSGANYLIKRKLNRSLSSGKFMDEEFQKLCFPRFYHYDILRGLSFLIDWARALQNPLPLSAIEEPMTAIASSTSSGACHIQRNPRSGSNTWIFDQTSSQWIRQPSKEHALLAQFTEKKKPCTYLSSNWQNLLEKTEGLFDTGLIQEGS